MSATETILKKSARLDRCLARIDQVTGGDANGLREDYDVQDVVVLNVLRACEQVIDVGQVLIRELGMPRPATNREVFVDLGRAGTIAPDVAKRLAAMVGFRNLAVHQYEELDADILVSIVERELSILQAFVGQAARIVR